MSTVDIGTLSDFEEGVPRQLHVEGRTLVAVRIDAALFVLDDRCSHEEFSLCLLYTSQGSVVEAKVVGHMAKPRHATYVRQ